MINFDLSFSFIEETDAFLFESLPKLNDFYVNESTHSKDSKTTTNENFQINENLFPEIPDVFPHIDIFRKFGNDWIELSTDINNNKFQKDETPLKKHSIVVKTPKKIDGTLKDKQPIEIDFCGHIFSPAKKKIGRSTKLKNHLKKHIIID